MHEAFLEGLLLVFRWPSIGFLFLGVLIGIWLGAVPGLGGILGLVLLLPFTYDMDTVSAFALLLGMFAVTTTSDTISSVMLGIPGTAASQALIVDGHPLAKKGQAARAFGASFTVSAYGGVIGALALAITLPIIRPFILSFNSPEIFMLGVLGLSMVGALSGASMAKGLAVAAFGLLIASIGYAQTESFPRYYFDIDYLLDGLPLIPVVIGLFGIPELLEMAVRNVSISRVSKEEAENSRILDGMRDTFRNGWLATRCAAIGTYVGILPGLGGSIVDWIAYGHTVQSAKDKSQFGKGDIRGVIGPDAANNASLGGALIPTVAFGIPGSIGSAILLGALILQGLKPGPEMLGSKLHITYSMVWSIVIANVVGASILLFWARQVAKVSFIPGHLIVPGVILFLFMGAWLGTAAVGDWVTCFVFGVLGFVMKRGGWPRPPLVLALVLGQIMEGSLILSMRIHDGFGWLQRPIVLIILALIVVTIVLSARGVLKSKRHGQAAQGGEGHEGSPLVSLVFGALACIVFVGAIVLALPWSQAVKDLPIGASVVGVVFVLLALRRDRLMAKAETAAAGGIAPAFRDEARSSQLAASAEFLLTILGMVLLGLTIGQKLAIPIFIAYYLLRWGKYGWKLAVPYAIAGWIVLVGFYDRVMHLFWLRPWLEDAMIAIMPDGFPQWLVL
jgi:TctA family transporter